MNRNTVNKIFIGLVFLAYSIFRLKTFDALKLFETLSKPKLHTNFHSSRITYGRFLEYLEMGWVKQVDLYANSRNAIVKTLNSEAGNYPQSIRVEIPTGASQLIQKLKEYQINFDAHPVPHQNVFLTFATNLLLPLIFIGSLLFFFQNSNNFSGPSTTNLSKSQARLDQQSNTGISFDDIAGIDEAKAELKEIVSFLKEPERYTLVGAKIPKGVLLIGPPGTGKTLLAKAIANEANVPFYSVAGSEFVEMFTGIGASRIRDLFKKASENSPCIVFIDEIDAVGRERGAGIGGGNDEREQTLNQLLTEMDGFKENKGVIAIGATNRADILDTALLRPGRFDRQITINLPDRLSRIGILKIHAQNKSFHEDVSLIQLANRTPGFSGADLANVLNEAAILATRYKKQKITKNEVNEATDRIVGGILKTTMEDSKNKKLIAYHEVGRAIVGSILENHDEVDKIMLTPRGMSKGLTWFTSAEDQMLLSRSQLLARIITMLAGRLTEQLIFGESEINSGADQDLQQVTKIARQMVTQYGMSNIGPIDLESDKNKQMFVNEESNNTVADRIDVEICVIIQHCTDIAAEIILENRVVIDLLVEKLLDIETMDGSSFRNFVKEYTILPYKS